MTAGWGDRSSLCRVERVAAKNHRHVRIFSRPRPQFPARVRTRGGYAQVRVTAWAFVMPPFCTGRDVIKQVLDSYCVFGYTHGLPDSQRPSSPSVRKDKPHLSLQRSLHGVPCTTAIKPSVSENQDPLKRKYNRSIYFCSLPFLQGISSALV